MAAMAFLWQSCNKRDNYTDGASVLDIVNTVQINGKAANINHVAGRIDVSLPGATDIFNVEFKADIPDGLSITPESGSIIDLSTPQIVVVKSETTERSYTLIGNLLPSKIAFLGDGATLADCSDDDVLAAGQWAKSIYGDNFVYIPYSDISDETLEGVNVIFYVHDQVGSSAQPAELLANLNPISKFFVQGGKIVAGMLGTGIVEELGRDTSKLRNIIGTGAGGNNPDTWGVGFANTNLGGILSSGCELNGDGNVFVIDSGYKEDHNALWNLGADFNYASFGSAFDAEVIGAWDWSVAGQGFAGIVLFNPSGRFKGSIMCLGIGGMEFAMNDGRTNQYQGNVEQIYKNAIDYMASK